MDAWSLPALANTPKEPRMTEEIDLKEQFQRPAQLQPGNGLTESYSKLEAALIAWRRLPDDAKAAATIWCDGEVFERADIEVLDAIATASDTEPPTE
jgi:hypothetical protein